jgi:hypothetical protein
MSASLRLSIWTVVWSLKLKLHKPVTCNKCAVLIVIEFWFILSLSLSLTIYIYIYIYLSVPK